MAPASQGYAFDFDWNYDDNRVTSEEKRELLLKVLEKQLKRKRASGSILGEWDLREAPANVRRVAKVLREQKVEFVVEESSVLNTLDVLRKLSGLNVVISRKAREALEDDERKLSLNLKDISLENAFNLVTVQLKHEFRFTVRYGVIQLVTKEEYRPLRTQKFYVVHNLVRQPPDFPAPKLGLFVLGESQ